MAGETILVVGGAGYIGSHMVLDLLHAGHEVIVLDNLSRGHRDLLVGGTFIEGDLGDAKLLDSIFSQHQIAAVMHFAAFSLVGESVSKPLDYYRNNVAKTVELLAAMGVTVSDTLFFPPRRRFTASRARWSRCARMTRANPPIPTARRSSRSKECSWTTLPPVISGMCRCVISMPPVPIPPAGWVNVTARNPSDSAGIEGRHGRASGHSNLRNGLSYGGWHLRTRLRPCLRSDTGASSGAGAPSERAETVLFTIWETTRGIRCVRWSKTARRITKHPR
jgi:hypothetical protein